MLGLSIPPRTVFITGGSSGLGRCAAQLFAGRGWRVGLIARNAAGLAASAADIRAAGADAAIAVADVSDPAALRAAAASLVAALGRPDVWVNCAGNGVYGRLSDVPEAEFDRVTDVTYGGTVHGCRTALGLMRPAGRGTIVNVCSAMAFHGLPLMTSYAGAKAAVRGFSHALRAELAIERSAIRVSTVFPPAVNTPFFSHAVSHMGWPARPAPPVYQPEIVARGIVLAAETGRAELVVSGTAALFELITRASQPLAAFLIRRLRYDRQLTQDDAAQRLECPTLFTAASEPSPVRGPFGRHARTVSLQLGLRIASSAGLAILRRQAVRWRPIPPRPKSDPPHAGSAVQSAAASHRLR